MCPSSFGFKFLAEKLGPSKLMVPGKKKKKSRAVRGLAVEKLSHASYSPLSGFTGNFKLKSGIGGCV